MRKITEFDAADYLPEWRRFTRNAVRAVILRSDGKIALVKSLKEGYYKFPGGGIKRGETHLEALVRETREETGLVVLPETVGEYGLVHEIRKSLYNKGEIFEQNSYYYTAEVSSRQLSQKLDKYEAALGYVLDWADMEVAYETNIKLSRNRRNFLLREAAVLKELIENRSNVAL